MRGDRKAAHLRIIRVIQRGDLNGVTGVLVDG
jgi:hypothetical protein